MFENFYRVMINIGQISDFDVTKISFFGENVEQDVDTKNIMQTFISKGAILLETPKIMHRAS